MFPQRNNPYCDLLQFCEDKINIFFEKNKKKVLILSNKTQKQFTTLSEQILFTE